jgi:hypothetical protein
MAEAATRDIAAVRGAKEWPAHTIALNLTLHASDGRHSISLAGMANGIDVAEVLNLVSPPGTERRQRLCSWQAQSLKEAIPSPRWCRSVSEICLIVI